MVFPDLGKDGPAALGTQGAGSRDLPGVAPLGSRAGQMPGGALDQPLLRRVPAASHQTV